MYYFGYGATINPKFMQQYGIEPTTYEPAFIENTGLVFNVRDYFRLEGGTPNLASNSQQTVHGVVYQLIPNHLQQLASMHGLFYHQTEITVQGYNGQAYEVSTFIGVKDHLEEGLQPSSRYMDIMLAGGRFVELEGNYIATLQRTEIRPTPAYETFLLQQVQDKVFTADKLMQAQNLVAIAGAVFDVGDSQIFKEFAGKDMSMLLLKRMKNAGGEETQTSIRTDGLTNLQRRYFNAYLHEMNRNFKLIGCMDYQVDLEYRSPHVHAKQDLSDKSTSSRIVLQSAEQINTLLGHENLGFLSEQRGLVPQQQTTSSLPDYYEPWEEIANNMPKLYWSLQLRSVLDEMPILSASKEKLADRYLLRACSLLSMIAHAYHNVRIYPPPGGLPDSISKPWQQVQQRLQRTQGVLSYIDLIVYNWRLNPAPSTQHPAPSTQHPAPSTQQIV